MSYSVEDFGYALPRSDEDFVATVEQVLELTGLGIFAKQELDVVAVALLFFDDQMPPDEFLWDIGVEKRCNIFA